MSDDHNHDENSVDHPPVFRQLRDDYYRPDDYYREGTNSQGDVIHVNHADVGFVTEAVRQPEGAAFEMAGRPPQKEQGSPEVCVRLAKSLSETSGIAWVADPNPPSDREAWADGFITSANGERVGVQVTRVGRKERWAEAGALGRAAGTTSNSDAADELWAAIERKLPQQDSSTILALSGGQPGYYAFASVVDEFRRRHATNLKNFVRYREVWIVGYSSATTHRIFPV